MGSFRDSIPYYFCPLNTRMCLRRTRKTWATTSPGSQNIFRGFSALLGIAFQRVSLPLSIPLTSSSEAVVEKIFDNLKCGKLKDTKEIFYNRSRCSLEGPRGSLRSLRLCVEISNGGKRSLRGGAFAENGALHKLSVVASVRGGALVDSLFNTPVLQSSNIPLFPLCL